MTALAPMPGGAPPGAETLRRFIAIVGEANAVTRPEDMVPYLREWRDRYTGRAALILRPGTVAEVSDILRLAAQTRTAIVPQGGNTGLVGGQIPFESGHEVVVSLGRLNRIRSLDARGNTLIAEAGVTLHAIQEAADAANRLFPLSLASEGTCQIGGNLATNAGGVQVLAYGNARDLTLGLEVVLPGGGVWNGLKRLRKDNTGYDLKNLFIGSEGTLGIITAAALRLFPKPRHQATLFAGFAGLDAVARFFDLCLERAGPGLTLYELMPRIGLDFVLKHIPGSRDPLAALHPWYVLAEISSFTGDEAGLALAQGVLEAGLEHGLVRDAVLSTSLAQARELRSVRESLSEVQKHEGGSIKHDVSVPVESVPAFIEEASRAVRHLVPGARPVPFGHFGDGNIHFNVSQPEGANKEAFLARWDEVSECVHAIVLAYGGSISAEHGIGRMKREMLAQVKPAVELEMMRSIKAALDPLGIMNPGKLL